MDERLEAVRGRVSFDDEEDSIESLVAKLALTSEATTRPTAAATGAASKYVVLPKRYEDLGRLASGGMGEVRRARDLTMNRVVAIKILHWQHVDSGSIRARFLHEAEVTASLQHPGVVPVHDRGELPDGRPWFSMQEVRGKTLKRVIRAIHETRDPTRLRSRVQQLLNVLHRMTETVAYAHSLGFVHRDIKPGNLMVGEFGEALVMDWGIGRKLGEDERPPGESDPSELTQDGDIVGTLGYMAPEQAKSEEATPASDVFALGVVLFEALTGQHAFEGTPVGMLAQLCGGWGFSLEERLRERSVVPSDALHAIVVRAAHPEAARRYEDAADLSSELRRWLDGDERRRRARALLAKRNQAEDEIARLRAQLDEANEVARAHAASIQPFDDVPTKLPLWRAEDRVASLRAELERQEGELVETLRFSLQYDPELSECDDALAAIAQRRLEDCEELGDTSGAVQWLRLLRHHRPRDSETLEVGTLDIDADPSASVEVRTYRVVDRLWTLDDAQSLGSTPVKARALPVGRHLLTLRAEGRATTHCPLWIRRGRALDADVVRLPRAESLDADDVHVPAGPFVLGCDAMAPEPFPRETVEVDSFIIRRFPVTNAEFLDYLNALVRDGEAERALRTAPRLQAAATAEGAEPLAYRRDEHGLFRLAPDELGRDVQPDWPVALVDWYSACAYADWVAHNTGKPWRLPCEVEWEKAARGVDARPFPWGDQPESTWARTLGSTGDTPGRAPVDGHPIDVSPYGVRGMAGNVRDWCINVWRRHGPSRPEGRLRLEERSEESTLRVIRGGAWNSVPNEARVAGRFAALSSARFPVVGFRLARSLTADD